MYNQGGEFIRSHASICQVQKLDVYGVSRNTRWWLLSLGCSRKGPWTGIIGAFPHVLP